MDLYGSERTQRPLLPHCDSLQPLQVKNRLNTVYKQHLRYLRSQNDDRDPLKAFEADLEKTLAAWIEDGERILLGMDANQDVRSGSLSRMLAKLGMRDIILARHQAQGPPPATYERNESEVPIDGIFANFDCLDVRCGYMDFGDGLPGDHRTLWADLPYRLVFGHTPPNLYRRKPQVLNTKDPRLRDKYNERIDTLMTEQNIPQLAATLRRQVANLEVDLATTTWRNPVSYTHLTLPTICSV